MPTSHHIRVTVTQKYYNNGGYDAYTKPRKYIRGAFSRSPIHSASIEYGGVIDAPTERINQSFIAENPCNSQQNLLYDNLMGWWDDVLRCDIADTANCQLLITNRDGGSGKALGNRAISEGGQNLLNLPDNYWLYGCSRRFADMQTVFHEIGHCFMGMGKDGEGVEEHDVGITYNHGSNDAKTPMGLGSNGYNECNEPHNHEPDGCNQMEFSRCCEEKMRDTGVR